MGCGLGHILVVVEDDVLHVSDATRLGLVRPSFPGIAGVLSRVAATRAIPAGYERRSLPPDSAPHDDSTLDLCHAVPGEHNSWRKD